MGLEILAGRIIAPAYGSSIYTWGSIIGVFLTALSLGYHIGGRRARLNATHDRITAILLFSAVFVALVIAFGDLIVRATGSIPLPARFASVLPVTILFGPPVYLLGFISPYAAELSRKQSAGAASGHVYALGTAGSIVGAFGTTFFLIPWLSIELIGLLFGGLLVGAAATMALPSIKTRTVGNAVVVGLLLVGAAVGSVHGATLEGDVVYETQTPYQQLRVVDADGVRTLYLGGQRHSAMDLDQPTRHVYDYTRYFHLPLLMRDDIDRVLFIGGGGFTGPKIFAKQYNVTVDVAEIDPVVIRVAKQYFGVEESSRMRIINRDGRRYLQNTNRTYDLIILDAYQRDKVPFQLTTVEFMRLTSQHLDEEGILFANVIAAPSGSGSRFYRAEYKTMQQVFPRVYAFPTSNTGLVQNIELIATKNATRISQSTLYARNERRAIGIDLTGAISYYRTDVPTEDVPVLRDDNAPVDRLLEPMMGRRYIIEQNGSRSTENVAG
ncbi:MAG: spermidine synthase [Halobacteriales archaeon]